MIKSTYQRVTRVHEDFSDRLQIQVSLINQDVTNRTSTLNVSASLFNENIILGNIGTYYIRVYVDGVVEPNLISFFYGGVRPNQYALFTDKQIVIQHSTQFLVEQEATISVKVNFANYYWDNPDDDDSYYDITGTFEDGLKVDCTFTLPAITNRALVTNAPAFSDRENYTIQYNKLRNVTYDKLEAAILFSEFGSGGANAKQLVYRDITNTQSSSASSVVYTFQLTEAELIAIRQEYYDANSLLTRVLITTTYDGVETDVSENVIGSIIPDYPDILNPVVKETNTTIIALTGDENVVVKGEGLVEFSYDAVANKEAILELMSITNGDQVVSDMTQGVIDDPTSSTFTIRVEDTRGLVSVQKIEKTFVDYVKPTCTQKVTNELYGEVDSIIKLELSGDFYNGSFGAVENELKVELRHTQEDGNMGEWIDLTDGLVPIIEGNRYTFNVTVSGFIYNQTYTFQSRVSDKINTVITDSYTTSILPLFDWGTEDFNLNLPLNMYKETILRYNRDADNTVLSASGGNIYLRPNGTDSTSGEVMINRYGEISINGEPLRGVDHVVARGREDMGTNGTWYWTKWQSGKAECFGCRNYGAANITTTWGNLYRSSAFTQDLPSGLFATVPEVISIDLRDSNFGGWIVRYEETLPSKDNIGSFIICRPASATMERTNVSIQAIGRWKAYEEVE